MHSRAFVSVDERNALPNYIRTKNTTTKYLIQFRKQNIIWLFSDANTHLKYPMNNCDERWENKSIPHIKYAKKCTVTHTTLLCVAKSEGEFGVCNGSQIIRPTKKNQLYLTHITIIRCCDIFTMLTPASFQFRIKHECVLFIIPFRFSSCLANVIFTVINTNQQH